MTARSLLNHECRAPSGRKQFWGLSKSQAVGLGFRITGLWPENDSAGEDHPGIRYEPYIFVLEWLFTRAALQGAAG